MHVQGSVFRSSSSVLLEAVTQMVTCLRFSFFAAGQEDPGEVQPLPGCGEQEQAGGGGLVHRPPHLSAHCDPGLLLHTGVHDGVSNTTHMHANTNNISAGLCLPVGKPSAHRRHLHTAFCILMLQPQTRTSTSLPCLNMT